jgi:hypothetical protein
VDDNNWTYVDKMKRSLKLSTKGKLPGDLVNQYRVPPHLPDLEGTTVSLEKCRLPKFSIANEFYVGRLGKTLEGLTLPERLMTQLASILAVTRVMRGGRHRCIRSHCIAFDCTPGPPFCYCHAIEDVSSYFVFFSNFRRGTFESPGPNRPRIVRSTWFLY